MNDSIVREKLTKCFRAVFPGLPEAEISKARVDTVASWDSVAGITLLNLVAEEFQREVDFEELAELDSFEALVKYLSPNGKT
jgi:acyl carrier protein